MENQEVREKTALQKLKLIIKERLGWFEHVLRMDEGRLPEKDVDGVNERKPKPLCPYHLITS